MAALCRVCGLVVFGRRIALFPSVRLCISQRPAHFGSSTMGFIAITFIASTVGMLVATAWEVVRRAFGRHSGRGA
jgi:hypothetical protein